MVCDRCILVVRQQLEAQGFTVEEIILGKVTVSPEPDAAALQLISSALGALGFELIDNDKDQLVEQIKTQIIALVHYSDLSMLSRSLMSIIAEKLNKDHVYLSRLFSDSEGLTIEKYIIQQKVERVKELLEYGELNLNEIAFQMGYSSGAHLSTQFKAVAGIPPSRYSKQLLAQRQPLDKIANYGPHGQKAAGG